MIGILNENQINSNQEFLDKLKPFYLLRGVEYSTNFNDFSENQCYVVSSNGRVKICSKLESFVFLEYAASPTTVVNNFIREIHRNLLNGKFKQGKFIN